MATLNLRWFTNELLLREITPDYLLRLIAPHASWFRDKGVALPAPGSGQLIDYAALREVLLNLDRSTPSSLIDSLYYVNELATTEGMDALLDEVSARGLRIDDDQKHAPIDVAIQVWLLDQDLLQEKHAEQHLLRRRSYQYFQTNRPSLPDFKIPDLAACRRCEASLDEWFTSHRRGGGARIFIYPREDGIWFLVRHGHTFRRESSSDDGEPGSVAFRPLKFDVLVYDPRSGEIRMNAETVGEKTLYRQKVGLHFFGDENFFPGDAKYTLEPLRTDGRESLHCGEIEGIEWIRLKEVQFYRGGPESETEIRKAKDVFAAYEHRKSAFPTRARITRAVFEIKFTDCKTPRSVTIKPSNVAQYVRDHDSVHVEAWLRARGFMLQSEVLVNGGQAVLAHT